MSIYKPSLLRPELAPIDVTQDNVFSCQVNTSGTSVKAYKFLIYSSDGNELLYDSNSISIGSMAGIKNKGTLAFPVTPSMLGNAVINGRDYLWNVRVYDADLSVTTKPKTLVCTGFLVGSTRYVIWTNNNSLIETDRWVEISTTNTAMLPILGPNPENKTLPKDGETHRERHKISWVDKELGFSKNYTKIELDEPFEYNYKDGTSFTLYNCSDQHTLTSVYVDPNDEIERGRYIILKNSSGSNVDGGKKRKIIGYGEETGEIRVQEAFTSVPTNGMRIEVWKYDQTAAEGLEWTNVLDGKSPSYLTVGGTPTTNATFKIITNKWDSTTKRLFIQPNINIKSDLTNPDEIVFLLKNNVRIRLAIQASIDNGIDKTFDKLDNTQWLIQWPILREGTDSLVPISPQTPYSVFTDFLDSAPMAYFYARKTPVIYNRFRNYNDKEDFYKIPDDVDYPLKADPPLMGFPWRDIAFGGYYYQENGTQIKYYQYFLYDEDGELIAKSQEKYDNELYWYYRGFQTSEENMPGLIYTIKLRIVDEYDKEFNVSNSFRINYNIEENFVPLDVQLNCDERGMDIKVVKPAFVETTDYGTIPTVTVDNLNIKEHYLLIPADRILNYTNLKDLDKSPFTIPLKFTYYTQFLMQTDFVDQAKNGEELTIMEFSYTDNEGNIIPVQLKFGGIDNYFVDSNNQFIENTNRFKLLLYVNNESANLFNNNGGWVNWVDISKKSTSFITPESIRFALQKIEDYIVIDNFPLVPVIDTLYLLNKDLAYNGKMYYPGVYIWSETLGWQIQTDYDYIFLENLSQYPGQDFNSLNVPARCRESATGNLRWFDTNNVWVEAGHINKYNKSLIEKYWYEFYFVSRENGRQTCEIRVNTKRK